MSNSLRFRALCTHSKVLPQFRGGPRSPGWEEVTLAGSTGLGGDPAGPEFVQSITNCGPFLPLVPGLPTPIGRRWKAHFARDTMHPLQQQTHDGAHMTSRHKGFTLIELMVVVVVIAILAAIALPGYRDYVQRGKLVEAFNGLSEFRVRMEQFYQDNRKYDGAGLGGCGAAAPTSRYFTFTCLPAAAPAQTYVATANGVAGEGMGGFQFTVNEANARQTVAVGSGWLGAGSTCWVRRKEGTC